MTTLSEGTKTKATVTKPTVLVIDDEAGPRNALKVILRPFFNIQSAENAKSALEVLRAEHIDLITLDQRLPDRQGMDLLQDIKHDHADIEVVIITGYGSLRSAMEGIRQGAAGYLLKPFNVTELLALINQTLEKKKRLDFIRNFFRSSPELWGSEQESAQAWQAFKSSYFALGPCGRGDASLPHEQFGLLPLLSDILEAKDKQLLNHSSRVSFYATLMGNRLNLACNGQKALTMGAFLHDIGKMKAASYRRDDDLSTFCGDEASCKEHHERAAQVIRALGFPAEVGQIVAYYHERWDGQGYPNGLRGEGIPLLARIVSIAHTFDHLTAEVPGRTPLSIDDAVRLISLQSHTHFDPKLIDLFIEVVNESKTSFPPVAVAATTGNFSSP